LSEKLHIYTRVSTSAQEDDGTSLESQKELGIHRAKELGMLYQVWNEGGQSSHGDDLKNRPQLSSILTEVDNGNIKHLWVYNTDRLSRNENTWSLIRLKLIKNHVTLYTASGLFSLSNPLDKLLLGVLSEISSYDNQLRAERSRIGKIKRIQQGCWMGGPPPYGYMIQNKHLIPNPDEVTWVHYIFKNYADGKSAREIRQGLMENGIKTRRDNSVWSLGSIEALLTNTHYSGYYVVQDKIAKKSIRVICPALLDNDLIQAVAKQRLKRRERRVRESKIQHFYLLRDFLVCGHCGARFSGRIFEKQNRSVYYCPRKQRNYVNKGTSRVIKCTNSRYLKIDKTDSLVWETVIHTLGHYGNRSYKDDQEIKKPEELAELTIRLNKEIKILSREIQEASNSLINVESDALLSRRTSVERERIIGKIEAHRSNLELKKDKLEKELHAFGQQKRWSTWFKEFRDDIVKIAMIPPGEQRYRFLKGVIDSIKVETLSARQHRLSIQFNLKFPATTVLGKSRVFNLEVDEDDDAPVTSKKNKRS